VYLDDDDPWTEALAYLGSTTADVNGDWSLTLPSALTANEGLHTISTVRNYGVIRNYEIGSSSKLSILFMDRPDQGVSSVEIITPTGDPATGELWTGRDHYFVAKVSPVEATLPITYVWEVTDLADQTVRGGVEKAVALYWDNPGVKTIKVMATGYDGNSVEATVNVTITDRIPLRGVSIDGPAEGYTGLDYTFEAQLEPPDATEPITYTWTPNPDSGQGTASATYRETVTGTLLFTVTAENYGGLFTGTHSIEIAQAPYCFVVEGVDLSVVTTGTIEADITTVLFSADISPDYADKPYTYTLNFGDGYTAPATSSADPFEFDHVFTSGGQHMVEIGVWNCDMVTPVPDSVVVDVIGEPAPCVSVTAVTIDGATEGFPNQAYTFIANVTPTSATLPLTYTWYPEPLSGQDTASATYEWVDVGAQLITATVENCAAALVTDTHSIDIVATTIVETVDPAVGGTIVYTDTNGLVTTITIPAGAFSETTTLTYTHVTTPAQSFTGFQFAGRAFDLVASSELSGTLIIGMDYPSDSVLAAMGIPDEMTLLLYYWTGSAWEDVANTCTPPSTYTRDTSANYLSVTTCHLTSFEIFGEAGTSPVDRYIYLPLVMRNN